MKTTIWSLSILILLFGMFLLISNSYVINAEVSCEIEQDYSSPIKSTKTYIDAKERIILEEYNVEIESTYELGEVKVDLYDEPVQNGSIQSINRIVGIHPDRNENLSANLNFKYNESDLLGLDEEDLILYSSIDNGASWTPHFNSIVNAENNSIELKEIEHFSLWTAASRADKKLRRDNSKNEAKSNSLPACVTIEEVKVSGCYYLNNASKATVGVKVSWTSTVISGGAIDVSVDGQTKQIIAGAISVPVGDLTGGSMNLNITSPQIVAFELDADGSTVTVDASYNGTFCVDDETVSLPLSCDPLVCATQDVGGVVFSDYNSNGIKDSSEEVGTENITVTAYTCTGKVISTTTDFFGEYVLNIASDDYPVRIEFSDIPAELGAGTVFGSDNGTTVQFASAGTCDINLGILNSEDFCNDAPPIFVPCYVNGALTDPEVGPLDAIVGFDYNLSGHKQPSQMVNIATCAEVGSTWGLAYDELNERLYSGSVLRRHTALGPEGLGGIYISDLSAYPTSVTTGFLDVAADLGVNVGTVPSNVARGITGGPDSPSNDAVAYPLIGKAGIGGIDLSADGNTLYFVNLFDNGLYGVDLTDYNANGTLPTATEVTAYPLVQACNGGSFRAWAVKAYKGKVYVGAVCDGSISGLTSDLQAFVFEINPSDAIPSFTEVLEFPLNYPKGFSLFSFQSITGWYTWTDDWNVKVAGNGFGGAASPQDVLHPEPIFAALEFDIDGSIVISLNDRTGLQSGVANYGPTGTSLYDGFVAGDILKGYLSNGNFILENNAKAGPYESSQVNNNQGPGFGEFYNDNSFVILPSGNLLAHAENVMGGLALRPGSGEVLAAVLDPLDLDIVGGFAESETFFAGGVRHWNNQTGNTNSAYIVYASREEAGGGVPVSPGSFSKAAGLGDLEIGCDAPEYLEIGNIVWSDDDRDGVQDACEQALAGVKVSLFLDADGSFLASKTTNANGHFYFSNTDGLIPNTKYIVVAAYDGATTDSQFNTDEELDLPGLFKVSPALTGEGANTSLNDNNADGSSLSVANGAVPASHPFTCVTTGINGTVDHTLDFGFVPKPTGTFDITAQTCFSINPLDDGAINLTAFTHTDKVAFSAGTTFTGPAYAAATDTSALPQIVISDIANVGGDFTIRLYNGSDANFTDVVVSVPEVTCSCWSSDFVAVANEQSFTDGLANNDGSIDINSTVADKFGVSPGATYAGPDYASANNFSGTFPETVLNNISNAGGAFTVRVFHGADVCFTDETFTFEEILVPSGSFDFEAATCSGLNPNDDGLVELTGSVNADKVGISQGAVYTGDDYNNAVPISTLLPVQITNSLVNAGGEHTIRVFNGRNENYVDYLLNFPFVDCSCTTPTTAGNFTTHTFSNGSGNNDAAINLTQADNADKIGISQGASYSGPGYDQANSLVASFPQIVVSGISNAGATYTIRLFNGKDACFEDLVITVPPVLTPSLTLDNVTATCNSSLDNNDGQIVLVGSTNTDRIAFSTNAVFSGPDYNSADLVTGTLPQVVVDNISNSGGFFTIRAYNGSNENYKDIIVDVDEVDCSCEMPIPNFVLNDATFTTGIANDDRSIDLLNVANGDRFDFSFGTVYNGAGFASATLIAGFPQTITQNISTAAQAITVRIYNQSSDCFADETIMVPALEVPVADIRVQAQTCGENGIAQDDGKIVLLSMANADKFGYSVGATYTGPDYSSSFGIGSILPKDLVQNISNLGEVYTVRIFNGSNESFVDQVINISEVDCSCNFPVVAANSSAHTFSNGQGNNDASIVLTQADDADRIGISLGSSYSGPNYNSANSLVPSFPQVVVSGISKDGATYTLRLFNGRDACFIDLVIVVPTVTEPDFTLDDISASCTSSIQNEDGQIILVGATNADRIAFSPNAVFSGPDYGSADLVSGTFPQVVVDNISNTGGFFTIRAYNGSNENYKDVVVEIDEVSCSCELPDPSFVLNKATFTNGLANDDRSVELINVVDGDRFDFSVGPVYTGAGFASATLIAGIPQTVVQNISTAGGEITIRVYNQSSDCFIDQTIEVPAIGVPVADITIVSQTCNNDGIAQNDGKVVLSSSANADKFGLSIGAIYTGPDYDLALNIGTVLPKDLVQNVSNAGEVFTVRVFNQSNENYVDHVVSLTEVDCSCTYPEVAGNITAHTFTNGNGNNDASIILTQADDSDRIGISLGASYTGPSYNSANSLLATFPQVLVAGIGNQGAVYTVRIFNGGNTCFKDLVFEIPPVLSPIISLVDLEATCTSTIENNDGQILLIGSNNADRVAISEGASFNGADYSNATPIEIALPQVLDNAVDNEGGFFTVRAYNGSDENYRDLLVSIEPVACSCEMPTPTFVLTEASFTNGLAENDRRILINNLANGDRFDVSPGLVYSGSGYSLATAVGPLPQVVVEDVASGGAVFTIRIFNQSDDCYVDETIELPALEVPVANFEINAQTCDEEGEPNNDGKILLLASSNADKIGYSYGSTYGGPDYDLAFGINAMLPQVVVQNITNVGAIVTLRVFNGSDLSYNDYQLELDQVNCCSKPTMLVETNSSDCTDASLNANGSIVITHATQSDKYSISSGLSFTGADYNNAESIVSFPVIVASDVSNTGGIFTVRLYNGSDDCYSDETVEVEESMPPNFDWQSSSPTFTLGFPNDDRTVFITNADKAVKAGFSPGPVFEEGGFVYELDELPLALISNISSSGGIFTIRVYNENENCYKDETIELEALNVPDAEFEIVNPNCTSGDNDNDGKIVLSQIEYGDKVAFSEGDSYDGPHYLNAQTLVSTPMDIVTEIPNTGGTFTIRIYNGSNNFYRDFTIVVDQFLAPVANISTEVSTCNSVVAADDGKVFLDFAENVDRVDVSIGSTYNGAGYALAQLIGTLPQLLVDNGSGLGEVFTVRLFNGSDGCFVDRVVELDAVNCCFLNEPLVEVECISTDCSSSFINVGVEVSWLGQANENIEVSFLGQTKLVEVSTGLVSPQMVQFNNLIPDGSTDNLISLNFENTASCEAESKVDLVSCDCESSSFIIDDFTVNNEVSSLTEIGSNLNTVQDAGIIGGERDLNTFMTVADEPFNVYTTGTGLNAAALYYSEGGDVRGGFELSYDGTDGQAGTLNHTGLNGMDFTASGVTDMFVLSIQSDLAMSISVEVFTDENNWSSAELQLNGSNSPIGYNLPFEQFNSQAGNGADMTKVGALRLKVNTTDTDGDLDMFMFFLGVECSACIAQPTATNDKAIAAAETAVFIDVQANDSDPLNGSLTSFVIQEPSNGSTTLHGGLIVYTPDPGFVGVDGFKYRITNSAGGSDEASVTVYVSDCGSPIVIDGFGTDSPFTLLTAPGEENHSDQGADILGGERDVLTRLTVSDPFFNLFTVGLDGLFNFIEGGPIKGSFELVYDGEDNDGEINTTGLGIDLTNGNNLESLILSLESDQDATLQVTVYSGENASTYSLDVQGSSNIGNYIMLFEDFIPVSGAGADFENVGALQVALDEVGSTNNLDMRIYCFLTGCKAPILDADGDEVSDLEDPDDDNDGIPDWVENGCAAASLFGTSVCPDPAADEDEDGVPNYKDPDFCQLNAFGICENVDFDNDGVPNFFDHDSDNDGIPDFVEASNPNPTGEDEDEDGIDDAFDEDMDGPGLAINPTNTDKDGLPDFLDVDSDNDGLLDWTEAGNEEPINFDEDEDGIDDAFDPDQNGTGLNDDPVDTDMDGIPDFRDVDSDDDGLTDNVESSPDPLNPILPTGLDTDEDGIDDAFDLHSGGTPITPQDEDDDGSPNHQDLDSDEDGLSDTTESDCEDASTCLPTDSDQDGTPDFLDTDTDNDGISDAEESACAIPLNANVVCLPADSDLDGTPDHLDLDSDSDGVPDEVEEDLGLDATNPDTDGDGINDGTELGVVNPVADPDGDGPLDGTNVDNLDFVIDEDPSTTTDPLSTDSDNDGIADGDEDTNHNGNTDDGETSSSDPDTDGDGLSDGTEIGLVDPALDPDGFGPLTGTDTSDPEWVPDADPASTTDPLNPDTDEDGYCDGSSTHCGAGGGEDLNDDGAVDTDESSPLDSCEPDPLAIVTNDCDEDGLTNGEELTGIDDPSTLADPNGNTTDPLLSDTDGDGVLDGIEAQDQTNPNDLCSYMASSVSQVPSLTFFESDCDEDGLNNQEELTGIDDDSTPADPNGNTTDPQQADTDGDGVLDGTEAIDETDPNDFCRYLASSVTLSPSDEFLSTDCDNDGLTNGEELTGEDDPLTSTDPDGQTTDPQLADTDGDGVIDGTEIVDGTNPNDLCDYISANVSMMPTADFLATDCDEDGLTNGEELTGIDNPDTDSNPNGTLTDPQLADSDGDGVVDGTEADDGTNPNDLCDYMASSVTLNPSNEFLSTDCDEDGLTNGEELTGEDDPQTSSDPNGSSTDPQAPDTDGDGVMDGTEADDGTNPNDLCDYISSNVTLAYSLDFMATDCDEDGLTNGEELTGIDDPNTDSNPNGALTNPQAPDTDGDGVLDGTEAVDQTDSNDLCDYDAASITLPFSDEFMTADCDEDGLTNGEELTGMDDPSTAANPSGSTTDPHLADSDGDGVSDGREAIDQSDPNEPCDFEMLSVSLPYSGGFMFADCDGDGLTNGEELTGIDQTATSSNPNGYTTDPFNVDTDGDGVTDGSEAIDETNPNDPCEFLISSVTLDVSGLFLTADCDDDGLTNEEELLEGTNPFDRCDPLLLAGCEEVCPDLSPVITLAPANIQAESNINVVIDVFELAGVITDGTDIVVRVPSDPRLTFEYESDLEIVGFDEVNNSDWTYSGNDGLFHIFVYRGVILEDGKSTFGFNGVYDPQQTDGETTITATIVPTSGGECIYENNTDAEKLIFFQ